MPDRENVIKGLTEISEYVRAKADIAGIGKGKEVFDGWYRAAEDALALLREQEPVAPKISNTAIPLSKTAVRFVETYWCGACGEAINQSDVFCRKCGKAVKWDD